MSSIAKPSSPILQTLTLMSEPKARVSKDEPPTHGSNTQPLTATHKPRPHRQSSSPPARAHPPRSRHIVCPSTHRTSASPAPPQASAPSTIPSPSRSEEHPS